MVNLDLSSVTEQVQVAQEFQQLEIREGELHLRFYVTPGQELALPAVAIREVISTPLDRITPIPNASPLLLGTLNLRGRVIWVADLGQLLGEPTALNTDRSEISVIAVEDQEMLLGLAVDHIVNMEWLDVEKLQQLNQASDTMAPFIRGEWVLNEHTHQYLRLLDQKAIVQSERWTA
jgi:twitching motility protein PilI